MRPVHAVILAGGRGTRFWPASRAARPKQCLAIVGERTMLVETFERLRPLVEPRRVWVVTGEEQERDVRAELPEVPAAQIVAEPVGRNTAAAVGLAARLVERVDPDATTIVLAADHHVAKPDRLVDVLRRAAAAAGDGDLVTIGITPTHPETGYGYIERGEPVADGVYRVTRFTEKPDRRRAEEFLASGRFLWNASIFAWRVDVIRRALARHLPDTDARLDEIVAAWGDRGAFARGYAALADVSIDVGVLEKSDAVAVVPGDFGWDDIGSWTALARLWPGDAARNATRGRVAVIDGSGNLVSAGRRAVALVGVDDLVVVETDDAVLVCRRERAQDVKRVVEELARRGWKDLL